MPIHRALACLVAAFVSLSGPRIASAQTAALPPAAGESSWPASPEEEESRLGRLLEDGQAAEQRQALALGIGGLTMGAAQVALGTYMLGRSDVAAQAIGPGLIVGGSADCILGIAPLLLPTPMSDVRELFESERAARMPAAQVVRDVEEKWRAGLERQRRGRFIRGIANLVIGIPAFTTGLVFALAKPGLAGLSSQTQYGWAGGLVGFDMAIYLGIASLLAAPAADTAFDTYQLLKHGTPAGVTAQVGLVPLRGGAGLSVGLSL